MRSSRARSRERDHDDGGDPIDAVLAAAALGAGAEALVSADRSFAAVRGLSFVELGSPELNDLIGAERA